MDVIIGVLASLIATVIWIIFTQFYDFNAKRNIATRLDMLYDCCDCLDSAIEFSNCDIAEAQVEKILEYCKEVFDSIKKVTYLPKKQKLFCTILYNMYYTVSYYKRVSVGYNKDQEREAKLQRFKNKYYYKVTIANEYPGISDERSFLMISIAVLQALNETYSVRKALTNNYYINEHNTSIKNTYQNLININNFKSENCTKYDLRSRCFTHDEYMNYLSKKLSETRRFCITHKNELTSCKAFKKLEKKTMANSTLSSASKAKNDEFYTQLTDIEKEMRYYKKHFEGKTVLCNCDDPFESNFFKYFVLNFNRLGLKKLIATCYATSPIANTQLSLFDVIGTEESKQNKPYKAVVTKVYDKTGDGGIDMFDVAELFKSGENQLSELEGDGDFRSAECLALLDEADIVVTNPPFSLFREYVSSLIEHNKKFIIIGNKNCITYKEIFPLLKNNEMWIGSRGINQDMWFIVSENNAEKIIDNIPVKHIMGCWFTNLDIKKRHEELILVKRYSPELYPKYDNYDAINIDKVVDIPFDYDGVMGVPITFLDKYNPDQFEILGLLQSSTDEQAGIPNLRYYNDFKEMRQDMTFTGASGGKANGNPVLVGKSQKGNFLYNQETKEYVHSAYARISIRNKHPETPKGGNR